MLLVIGYDKTSIERMRHKLRRMGFPSFGCTCRNLSAFPYMEDVSGVFFPAPISPSRTEYAISPIRKAYPHLPILAFLQESFTENDARACPSLTAFASAHIREKAFLEFLLLQGALSPKELHYACIYRHGKMPLPLIFGRELPLTPAENTLLTCFLMESAREILDFSLLREACFSLISPPQNNSISAAVHRLNEKLETRIGKNVIRYIREKGYAFSL